jgi:Flp pilus assembly protein TadD
MQKRRTADAVHVIMTDHRIRRAPLPGNPLAPLPERHDRLDGKVTLLYPRDLPASPETELYLAMAQGEPDALQQAMAKTNPTQSEPHLALAMALQKAGRAPEAIRAYRTLLQNFPDETRAYTALSRLMMEQGQTDQAIALLEPAASRLPNDPDVLNSLAVLYVTKQRFEDALQLLSRAVQHHPEDPVSWLNLGVSLEAKGDRAGASAAYQRTLQLDPASARAKAYIKRLAPTP